MSYPCKRVFYSSALASSIFVSSVTAVRTISFLAFCCSQQQQKYRKKSFHSLFQAHFFHSSHFQMSNNTDTTTTNATNSNNKNDNNEDTNIVERKKELRKKIRARLKELDKETIQQQSQQVWERLYELPQYQKAKSIGLFLSMPKGEIDTDPILLHAMKSNKIIYVPEVGKNFELADMELVQVMINEEDKKEKDTLFHKNWPRNKWNIPEPPPDMPIVFAKPGDVDILVVPGLAFDRNGDRLGQGKGYYDRFIERMCCCNDVKIPFLIAVGLEAQIVDENIPVATYDRRMDMVLLPNESIVVSKST